MRKHTHEKINTEHKLTDEQRRENMESKKLEAEKSGIYGSSFKRVHFTCVFVGRSMIQCPTASSSLKPD